MSFEPSVQWTSDEKGAQAKTKWSNFFIMINTNLAGDNEFEKSNLVVTLRRAVNEVFSVRSNLIKVIHIIDERGDVVTSEARRQEGLHKIEKVDSEAVIEIGPKVHRVHSHVLLMIQHKTRVQINVPILRDMIRKSSTDNGITMFENPVVRVKLIRENPINAIRMYQRGYKGKLPSSLVRKVQNNRF